MAIAKVRAMSRLSGVCSSSVGNGLADDSSGAKRSGKL
jgi:hypothetical protein